MIKTIDISRHPCFNEKASFRWGRIHLPIAPDCNIQCNFCSRRYHCVNETRPGVTRFLLDPNNAMIYLDYVLKSRKDITVIGIAGPGDPFCDPEITLKTLKEIHNSYPHMYLCVSTNGLNIYNFIDDLKYLGVTHVTITVNAIDPSIGEKIYSFIRVQNVIYRGSKGVEILIQNQLKSIKKLKETNFSVKVNTVVIPGINMEHVVDIAKEMASLKVDIMNCIPLIPLPDTLFSNIQGPTGLELLEIRKRAGEYLPQMHHCRRCSADATGLLCEKNTKEAYFKEYVY